MHEVKIVTGQRAVTAAGTAEKIKEAPEWQQAHVIAIRIRAATGNAGNIFIRNGEDVSACSTTGDIIAPGEVYVLDVSKWFDAYLDLSKIWIDAAVNGDSISYTAFEVIR